MFMMTLHYIMHLPSYTMGHVSVILGLYGSIHDSSSVTTVCISILCELKFFHIPHIYSYTLTVTARDRGGDEQMSSSATVFVTVEDENDNQPMIVNIASGVTTVEVNEVSG